MTSPDELPASPPPSLPPPEREEKKENKKKKKKKNIGFSKTLTFSRKPGSSFDVKNKNKSYDEATNDDGGLWLPVADVLSVEEIGNICSKAHHEFRSVKFLEQYLEDAIQEIPCPTAFAPSLEGKCVSCRKITCIKAHGMRCEFCDAMFCQKCKNEKLIPISPPLHFSCKAHSFESKTNSCANCGCDHDSHSRECEVCNVSYCVTCKKIKMKKVGQCLSVKRITYSYSLN